MKLTPIKALFLNYSSYLPRPLLRLVAGRKARLRYVQGWRRFRQHRFPEAAELFREAALLGHPQASYWLSQLYVAGCGVPQDHAAAFNWFMRVARHHRARSSKPREEIYDRNFFWIDVYGPTTVPGAPAARVGLKRQ